MDTLVPINLQTLGETVTERIRVAIISGELEPGEKIVEPLIAAKLGVSRSPVREALMRLESEGLVEKEANRSFRVWTPTEKDVDEIIGMRVMIETYASVEILGRISEKNLTDLENIFKVQVHAVQKNDHLLLTREDRRFHDYIISLTNNSRLIASWEYLMSQWEVLVYRRTEADPEISGTVLVDHRKFLDAFRVRDLDTLITLHEEINERVCRQMKAVLWKSDVSDQVKLKR